MRAARILSIGILAATFAARSAGAASFLPLGDLAGGAFESHAYGVSADGRTVVGQATTASGKEAFRWTADGGMQSLGIPDSDARGASADGSVIVGTRTVTYPHPCNPCSETEAEAYRWDDGAVTALRAPSDFDGDVEWHKSSYAFGVSADGSTVVGSGQRTGAEGQADALYPAAWSGGILLAPLGTSGGYGDAYAASADGSVFVGAVGPPAITRQAFRYADGTLTLLPTSTFASGAQDVSADGSIVVGSTFIFGPGAVPFRWTEAGGLEYLIDIDTALSGGIALVALYRRASAESALRARSPGLYATGPRSASGGRDARQ
jgi:probable HAF family extracellular repeat protein